jgi:hypothetical protein
MSASDLTTHHRDPHPPTLEAVSVDQLLASGEVHFLWWFIQGSIMDIEVCRNLRRAWGLCERHTTAWLVVEAAFRHDFLHGPAVVYADLLERATAAFDLVGPLQARRLASRLRQRGPCHLCALGFGPHSQGPIPRARLHTGRDVSHLLAFMAACQPCWQDTVCGCCAGNAAPIYCRPHLGTALAQDLTADLICQRRLVQRIADHLTRYRESFRWEKRGTDTVEDRAALISAAGWCSGWRSLLALAAGAQL